MAWSNVRKNPVTGHYERAESPKPTVVKTIFRSGGRRTMVFSDKSVREDIATDKGRKVISVTPGAASGIRGISTPSGTVWQVKDESGNWKEYTGAQQRQDISIQFSEGQEVRAKDIIKKIRQLPREYQSYENLRSIAQLGQRHTEAVINAKKAEEKVLNRYNTDPKFREQVEKAGGKFTYIYKGEKYQFELGAQVVVDYLSGKTKQDVFRQVFAPQTLEHIKMSGFEKRVRQQIERESKIAEVKSGLYRKLGIEKYEDISPWEPIELAKLLARLPVEIVSSAPVLGGRVMLAQEAQLRGAWEPLLKTFKQVPQAAKEAHDLREPEGWLNLILTIAPLKGAFKMAGERAVMDVAPETRIIGKGEELNIRSKGEIKSGKDNIVFFQDSIIPRGKAITGKGLVKVKTKLTLVKPNGKRVSRVVVKRMPVNVVIPKKVIGLVRKAAARIKTIKSRDVEIKQLQKEIKAARKLMTVPGPARLGYRKGVQLSRDLAKSIKKYGANLVDSAEVIALEAKSILKTRVLGEEILRPSYPKRMAAPIKKAYKTISTTTKRLSADVKFRASYIKYNATVITKQLIKKKIIDPLRDIYKITRTSYNKLSTSLKRELAAAKRIILRKLIKQKINEYQIVKKIKIGGLELRILEKLTNKYIKAKRIYPKAITKDVSKIVNETIGYGKARKLKFPRELSEMMKGAKRGIKYPSSYELLKEFDKFKRDGMLIYSNGRWLVYSKGSLRPITNKLLQKARFSVSARRKILRKSVGKYKAVELFREPRQARLTPTKITYVGERIAKEEIRLMKKANQDIKRAKTTSGNQQQILLQKAKKELDVAESKLKTKQTKAKLRLKIAQKQAQKTTTAAIRLQLTVLGTLLVRIQKQKQALMLIKRQKAIPIIVTFQVPKEIIKAIPKQIIEQIQKQVIVPKSATVTKQLPLVQQVLVVGEEVLLDRVVRIKSGKPDILGGRYYGGVGPRKQRKMIYLPDLVSLLGGYKATADEARRLLMPGRVFTGAERRKLVI